MAKLTRGERFKDARTVYNKHHKQTMDEVASATGVSKSMIQALEDDEVDRSVGYDKVVKLAVHYHVSTDFLLGLTENPFPQKSIIDELGLSPTAVANIKRFCIDYTFSMDPTDDFGKFVDSGKANGASIGMNALLEQKGIFQIANAIHELQTEIRDQLNALPKVLAAYNLDDKDQSEGFSQLVFRVHNNAKADALKKLILDSFGKDIDPNFQILYGADIIESKKRTILWSFEHVLNLVSGYKKYIDEAFDTKDYPTFHLGDDEFIL